MSNRAHLGVQRVHGEQTTWCQVTAVDGGVVVVVEDVDPLDLASAALGVDSERLSAARRDRKQLRVALARLLDAVSEQNQASGLVPILLARRREAMEALSDTARLEAADGARMPTRGEGSS